MEIKLIQNENGTTVGYEMVAGTKSEHATLLEIRNLHMFEDNDSPVNYDMMTISQKYPGLVKGVSFLTEDAIKERDSEISKRLCYKAQEQAARQSLIQQGFVQKGDSEFILPNPELTDVILQVTKKTRSYNKRQKPEEPETALS